MEIKRRTFQTAVIMVLIPAALAVSGCVSEGAVTQGFATQSIDPDSVVRIPVSEISGTARFYSFDADGKEIRFFAVLGDDGRIRTALDACEVCGGSKGYRQEGDDMVCNNCGRYFAIDDLGEKNTGGGCWPSYLDFENHGQYITIKKSDLSAAKWMF